MTPAEQGEIRRRIGINEGTRHVAYDDASGEPWPTSEKRGNPTIGIGYNLNRSDASDVCKRIGTDLHTVLTGHALTDAQVAQLFDICFAPILNEASRSVTNFALLTPARRFVICDLTFNLGAAGWGDFTTTRGLISSDQFDAAANHLVGSAWYAQVGGRAVRNTQMLRNGQWVRQ